MEATAKAQADNDLSKMLSEGRAEQGGGGVVGKSGVNWMRDDLAYGGNADKVED